ncbi:hypothetical protein HSX37_16380|uniref:Uncharacterized protein n=1 Tax=Dendrosporobacter quercicolus TaxID=146817 RepID=A0A1G9ZUE7_9FIRM|nr:hypothetical protein [Dendrosporobacter quercicolus]NSL49614.1 hypothetical protein [Dendrosporobacter quercicolus DSM 1736]SDN24999.1 hypothetical protein SAMN04488502_11570 [Dendrosporobacter quercicolus]
MDIKTRIETAKANLKRAEQSKTIAETQKAAAEQQREEVVQKMAAEGVTPETIGEEIANLETAITETLTTVEGLIPRV